MGSKRKEHVEKVLIQVKQLKGIPFIVRIPNEKTKKVLEDSQKGKNLKTVSTTEELFKDLGM